MKLLATCSYKLVTDVLILIICALYCLLNCTNKARNC